MRKNILTADNLKLLNEIIDESIWFNNGISVERTRKTVRTKLKMLFYKREISESKYLTLLNLNEMIANNYRYM